MGLAWVYLFDFNRIMKLLLIGYGKMGKAIEAIALERGHSIAGKADNREELQQFNTSADVAIEFSQPDAVIDNLKFCFDKKIPVVCGTTGWLGKKNEIDNLCKQKNGAFFYASNYSLGVNLFFKLNEHLAKLMRGLSGYDVCIDETHHTQKKDAPSGTAITLAEGIIKNYPSKKGWVLNKSQNHEELTIKSFRIDPTPGTHTVHYNSAIDELLIQHIAHSRQGFALGAVVVAEWLAAKTGIFSMDDFLKF
jgi:4-hydroxy-tetrahydrodipicolinate reductase